MIAVNNFPVFASLKSSISARTDPTLPNLAGASYWFSEFKYEALEESLTRTLRSERSGPPDQIASGGAARPSDPADLSALEPHFSVQVLAEMWRLDESTIRRIFEDAPGVLRLANERRRGKRDYVTLRIPASVAQREYERRLVALQKRGA